jgi:hypothetical protein
LFSTYTFGKSPYSLGGWVESFDSHRSAPAQFTKFVRRFFQKAATF